MNGAWSDVHGAGSQRSDPKSGSPADYSAPATRPQGDAIRINNYVRLVRDAGAAADPTPLATAASTATATPAATATPTATAAFTATATPASTATPTATATLTTRRSYPLVDTGQTACYDANGRHITCPAKGAAFYGQDAQSSGNQPSYTDNGNGTVTDNVTGLMWQQAPSAASLSWKQAMEVCATLTLAGQSDWRTPSLKELFSISDFSQGWPYLSTTYFHLTGADVSKAEQYWSSNYYAGSTVEGRTEAAFGVNHGTGHIKAYPAAVTGPMGKHVRCVRGDIYGVNQLVNNSNPSNSTGGPSPTRRQA